MTKATSWIKATTLLCGTLASAVSATNTSAQDLSHVITIPQDATVFGEIADVDVAHDGRIYVLDGQAKTVYVFGPDGSPERQLGREGQGPGEIMLSAQLEVGPSGDVLITDLRNQRLSMWSARGELIGERRFDDILGSGARFAHDLVWNEAGVFLKMARFSSEAPIDVYSVPTDLRGTGEQLVSIPRGDHGLRCAFCPMTLDDSAHLYSTSGDTTYLIMSFDAEGSAGNRWSRADLPALRRSTDDMNRAAAAVQRAAGGRLSPGATPTASEFETRFGPHSIGVDRLGQVWSAPRVPTGQPGFFDVFSPEGELALTIQLDVPLHRFRIRGDRIVIASETPIGEPVVRVYSIQREPTPPRPTSS